MATKTPTDTALKNLKPKDKLYKVSDGIVGGLQVAVSPKGKITFRLAYKFVGKGSCLCVWQTAYQKSGRSPYMERPDP